MPASYHGIGTLQAYAGRRTNENRTRTILLACRAGSWQAWQSMHGPSLPPPPPVNVGKLLAAMKRAALAAPLMAFDDWWLNVRCSGCPGSTSYPLRLLVQRHGSGTLAQVVNRLNCKRCRKGPASVKLTDDPRAGSIGAIPPTWQVELLGGDLVPEQPRRVPLDGRDNG